MLQWGLVMKLEWCQAKWLQKAPCPVGADPAHNLESWTEPPYFFNFSVTWHSALVQCLQEKKWYTILKSAWGRGVDVSVFLLFLCRDCCYDNKKLKISYPVKPVFSAKPAPVNLWNILGHKFMQGMDKPPRPEAILWSWAVLSLRGQNNTADISCWLCSLLRKGTNLHCASVSKVWVLFIPWSRFVYLNIEIYKGS